MGNVGINSVGTESVYQTGQAGRTECLAGVLRARGCLVRRPYPQDTHETQLSPSGLTLRISVMRKAHASFRGMLSHNILVKTLQSLIA